MSSQAFNQATSESINHGSYDAIADQANDPVFLRC